MTTEKTYESICKMLVEYDRAAGFDGASAVISKPWEWEKCVYNEFYSTAAKMLIDCRVKMDKATTPAAAIAAVKRICKSAVSRNDPRLAGIFEDRGLYAVCDGYRYVRLKNDLDSLPHVEKGVKAFDLAKCTPDKSKFTAEVPVPTAAELKAYIGKAASMYGKNNKISYEIAAGVFLDPHYLLDMVQIFPDCKAFITSPLAPVYFESENGDGLICAVHPNTAKTV